MVSEISPVGQFRSFGFSYFHRSKFDLWRTNFDRGVKCGWCVGLTTLPSSISRLFRKCGILNISQTYRPPRPVTGITLLYFTFLYSFDLLPTISQLSAIRTAVIVHTYCFTQSTGCKSPPVQRQLRQRFLVVFASYFLRIPQCNSSK
jgi:hypothetical protein